MCRATVFASIFALTMTTSSQAVVPQLVNYQGRLTEETGSPLSGSYDIMFKLYESPSGGASIWSETHSDVTVNDGLFAVALGSITPFSSASPAGNQIWLGTTVGSDPELSPRTQMVSVLFAFMADRADTASFSYQAGQVDTADYAGRSLFSDTADYAGRSLFSDTADYAGRSLFSDTADYAGRSLLSDTAEIAKGATDNSIGSAQLIDNNVTSLDIENGTIIGLDISSNAITSSHISDGAIQSQDLSSMGATDGQVIEWDDGITSWVVGDQIDEIVAGSGLSGGGTSGVVTVDVGTNSITSTHIVNGGIVDVDVNSSANIAVSKISGTAVNLTSNQTINGEKTFGDSTLHVTPNGITVGTVSSTSDSTLIYVSREFNTTDPRSGLEMSLKNNGTGRLHGLRVNLTTTAPSSVGIGVLIDVNAQSTSSAEVYGGRLQASSVADATGACFGVLGTGGTSFGGIGDGYGGHFSGNNKHGSSGLRYGVKASAGDFLHTAGTSYGMFAQGLGGTTAYGIFASASFGTTNYAGYFAGDVSVTGTLSKGGGSFRIDHPLDPENKYLQHSFVESPDMMNVYNGNITTGLDKEAVVVLPEYFTVLNRDFRYQLTVLGQFAQAIIAEKVANNQFTIETDKPNVEVSWQVTGIRQDKWANEHRIQVETNKSVADQGKYLHYKEYNVGLERAVKSLRINEDINVKTTVLVEHKAND